jgi:hypothetical protein
MAATSWRLWGRLASTGPASLIAPVHFRAAPGINVLWVDSLNGDDAKSGHNKEEPKKTIESAVGASENGTMIVLLPGFDQAVPSVISLGTPVGFSIVGQGEGAQQAILRTADADGLISSGGGLTLENIRFPESEIALTSPKITVESGGNLRMLDCLVECGTNDVRAAVYNNLSTLRTSGCTFRVTSGHPLQAIKHAGGITEIDTCLIDGGVFGWRDNAGGHQVAVEAAVSGFLDMHASKLRGHSDVFVHVDTTLVVADIRFDVASDRGDDCSVLFEVAGEFG